ncbi:MAG: histidine kinase N-terminal 7TM domain-containing protein [Chloroflexota bacterium]
MHDFLVSALRTLNELLTAGIAITAFSLLLYALSFNLRDHVARTFAMILVCVVITFVGEALSSVATLPQSLDFWLRLEWVGITFLPAVYLHFSDALLATTGRPSRGRRRLVVRLLYGCSLVFLITLPFGWLVGPLMPDAQPAPHLQRTWLTWLFTAFYAASMALAWINLWRSYRRTVTSASRRRMTYLLAGALAPALGSFPYLLFGFSFAARHPLTFWLAVTLSNMLVSALLVLMAYAVAFFGVPWPDRVVKRRLLKWIMRGPVTASSVLAVTTIIRRGGLWFGLDPSAIVPVVMVASILIFEHLITLAAPIWERWLFLGKDHADIQLLQTLDERVLTLSDLQQFLEAILAAVCDRLQASQAFLAALGPQGLEMLVTIGGGASLQKEDLSENLLQAVANNGKDQELFSWGDYWLAPIYNPERFEDKTASFEPEQEEWEAGTKELPLLGLVGILRTPGQNLDHEQHEALAILTERASLALHDRMRQQQAFSSLEALTPQMDLIQRMRAAARYDGTGLLAAAETGLQEEELSPWVKDALTHFWGGPKLTESPLLGLQVVQQFAQQYQDSPTNALRAILRKAIEHVRPEGERRFTGEWILYNILELKFMEGRKVREVAMRLAMSEADLYRKQRVAIEEVAKAIVEMERLARAETSTIIEKRVEQEVPPQEVEPS